MNTPEQAIAELLESARPGALEAAESLEYTLAQEGISPSCALFALYQDGGELLSDSSAEHAGVERGHWIIEPRQLLHSWKPPRFHVYVWYKDEVVTSFQVQE